MKLLTDKGLLKRTLSKPEVKELLTITTKKKMKYIMNTVLKKSSVSQIVKLVKKELSLIKDNFDGVLPSFEVTWMGYDDIIGYTTTSVCFDMNYIIRDTFFKKESDSCITIGINCNSQILGETYENQKKLIHLILLHEMRHYQQLHNGVQFIQNKYFTLENVNALPDYEVDAWLYSLGKAGYINE